MRNSTAFIVGNWVGSVDAITACQPHVKSQNQTQVSTILWVLTHSNTRIIKVNSTRTSCVGAVRSVVHVRSRSGDGERPFCLAEHPSTCSAAAAAAVPAGASETNTLSAGTAQTPDGSIEEPVVRTTSPAWGGGEVPNLLSSSFGASHESSEFGCKWSLSLRSILKSSLNCYGLNVYSLYECFSCDFLFLNSPNRSCK